MQLSLSTGETRREENTVKHGHVTGHKQERKGASDWYKHIEDEHIRRIEAEWAARPPQQPVGQHTQESPR